MEKTRKFLLFCPDISGHRHLYCRRLFDYLSSRGHEVALAYAGRVESISIWGQIRYVNFVDEAATRLLNLTGLECIDLKSEKGKSGSLKQLAQVAKAHGCTDVIHADADCFRFPLAFSAGVNASVRHHLLFICTEYVDWKQRVTFGRECLRLIKVLINGHARGLFIANRLYGVEMLPRVSEFLIQRIFRRKGVETILTTDERLSGAMDAKLHFIPELGTSHWECGDLLGDLDSLSARILAEVKSLCDKHAGKRVICMLGDLETRKGFDQILQLCAAAEGTVCIRVGRTKPTYQTTWESIEAKERLLQEGRIYEYDSYIPSWDLFRELMALQDVVVLPYKNFFRTSGVFIDTLVSGKPVIVPEAGLMGWRVKKYSLGAVFQGGSSESLLSAYRECIAHLGEKQTHVVEYASRLEKETFYKSLDAFWR